MRGPRGEAAAAALTEPAGDGDDEVWVPYHCFTFFYYLSATTYLIMSDSREEVMVDKSFVLAAMVDKSLTLTFNSSSSDFALSLLPWIQAKIYPLSGRYGCSATRYGRKEDGGSISAIYFCCGELGKLNDPMLVADQARVIVGVSDFVYSLIHFFSI